METDQTLHTPVIWSAWPSNLCTYLGFLALIVLHPVAKKRNPDLLLVLVQVPANWPAAVDDLADVGDEKEEL
jgi:hypothetical protein